MPLPRPAPRLLLLCGSLRARSRNATLLRRAAELSTGRFTAEFYAELDLLPAFNPDVEERGEADAHFPPAARRLRTLVASSDAMLISSPEYAHGVPGALKNALDWLVGSTTFPGLPVGLIHLSDRSTHAPAQLQETLRTMSAELVPDAWMTLSPDEAIPERWDAALDRALDALHRAVVHSPRSAP